MKLYIFLLILFTANLSSQERKNWSRDHDIPRWVKKEFAARCFDSRYAITYQLYPAYFRGDFNGDRMTDVAILVKDLSSGKLGIAIFHGKNVQKLKRTVSILGAGQSLGSMGDNFTWMKLWELIKKSKSGDKPVESFRAILKGDALKIRTQDDRSGLVYWNGTTYTWTTSNK